jgi:hypothetical protein
MNLSFAIVFAMAAGHAINHVITSMQETREKRAKRDSIVQLHAAISKLAHSEWGPQPLAPWLWGRMPRLQVDGTRLPARHLWVRSTAAPFAC